MLLPCQTCTALPQFEKSLNTMSTHSQKLTTEVEIFDLRDGMIESEQEQGSVNAFAADFQALCHFGERIGSALNLGPSWMGAVQENGLTVAYCVPEGDLVGGKPGKGGRVPNRALLFEMLTTLNDN